jgi:hypothetical protein
VNKSILDLAAELTWQRNLVGESISLLRNKERLGDWTQYDLMVSEAMVIAFDGLRNTATMLMRIRQLVEQDLKSAEFDDPPPQP